MEFNMIFNSVFKKELDKIELSHDGDGAWKCACSEYITLDGKFTLSDLLKIATCYSSAKEELEYQ
jgi:23S rRNA maturation mini-RNase III